MILLFSWLKCKFAIDLDWVWVQGRTDMEHLFPATATLILPSLAGIFLSNLSADLTENWHMCVSQSVKAGNLYCIVNSSRTFRQVGLKRLFLSWMLNCLYCGVFFLAQPLRLFQATDPLERSKFWKNPLLTGTQKHHKHITKKSKDTLRLFHSILNLKHVELVMKRSLHKVWSYLYN